MSYQLEFSIKGLPKIMSNGSHGHWAVNYKMRKTWRNLVKQAIGTNKPSVPLKVASAEFIRCSNREPDFDNLCISFKSIVDGLVEHGILENDKPSNLPNAQYKWEHVKSGQGHVKIKITEVTA